jgi:integration host factor subunit beta
MTKSEIIDILAAERNLPRRTAEDVVNLMLNAMKNSLVARERIELRGFGTFRLRQFDGYTGRNPKTNDAIIVEAKVLPVFRVGKSLLDRVNSREQ